MKEGTEARSGALETSLLHRAAPYLLAAILVIAVKGLLVLSLADVFFYGEVLEKGAAAKALLDGLPVPRHQLAYHYYEGGGFAISHLTALAFLLVGENLFAHSLVSLTVNLAIALVGVAFVGRNFGRSAAHAFALLYTLAPSAFQKLSLLNLGIHYESSLFLLLSFHFALRLALDRAPTRAAALAFGLSCGFGAFFSFLTLPASLFLALLVPLLSRSALRESRWLFCAWGVFLGAAPFFWMWISVGNAIFDIHGTPLFEEAAREASVRTTLHEFATSLSAGRGFLESALLALRMTLPIAGAFIVARLRHDRAARAALAILAYLALFAAVYAASPFAVGEVVHHFQLLRLAPFWCFGTVLTAALVGALRSADTKAARRAGGVLLALLAVAGADASRRAIQEGRPAELRANTRLLFACKGYTYPGYFAKFTKHLEGDPEQKLRVLLAFDEPDPEILRSSAAEAVFRRTELTLAEIVDVLAAVDSEHWQDFLLGLGPYCLQVAKDDVWKALAFVSASPPRTRRILIEAIGRGNGWGVRPERLEKDLAQVRGRSTPDAWYRGLGYNVYLAFRLDPAAARAFIERVPSEHRETVKAAYERSRRLHTLEPA